MIICFLQIPTPPLFLAASISAWLSAWVRSKGRAAWGCPPADFSVVVGEQRLFARTGASPPPQLRGPQRSPPAACGGRGASGKAARGTRPSPPPRGLCVSAALGCGGGRRESSVSLRRPWVVHLLRPRLSALPFLTLLLLPATTRCQLASAEAARGLAFPP